ncbi:hypothetical protein D1007_12982 [Hordeum vulgare]|nr:hypothetical protein D1007_12982 [Hordeum vulgare]
MITQEEAHLIQRVMEDSMMTHDERQWPGLEDAMALCAAGDVAIPEHMEAEEVMEDAPVAAFPPNLVGQQWSWSCTASEMARAVGGVNWCPTPPRKGLHTLLTSEHRFQIEEKIQGRRVACIDVGLLPDSPVPKEEQHLVLMYKEDEKQTLKEEEEKEDHLPPAPGFNMEDA